MSILVSRCRYEGEEEQLKELLCKETRGHVSVPYPVHPSILPQVAEAFDSAVEEINPPAHATPLIKPNTNTEKDESLYTQVSVTNTAPSNIDGRPCTPMKGGSSSHLDRCYTSPLSSLTSSEEQAPLEDLLDNVHANDSIDGVEQSVMMDVQEMGGVIQPSSLDNSLLTINNNNITGHSYVTVCSDQERSYLTANDDTISAHTDLNTVADSESALVLNDDDDDLNESNLNTDLNLNTDSVDLITDSSVFHSSQVNEPDLPIDNPVPIPPVLSIESIESTSTSFTSCSCDTEAPVADQTDYLESSFGMDSSCAMKSLPSPPPVMDSTSLSCSSRRSSRKNRFKIAANFCFGGKENKPQNMTTPTLIMSLPSTRMIEGDGSFVAPPFIRTTPPSVRATPPFIRATPISVRAALPIRATPPSIVAPPPPMHSSLTLAPPPSLLTSSHPKVSYQSLPSLMDPSPSHYTPSPTPPTDTLRHSLLSSQSPPSLVSHSSSSISPDAKKTLTPGKTLSINIGEIDKKIQEQERLIEKQIPQLKKRINLYQKSLQEKTGDEDIDLSKELDEEKCRLVDRIINANINRLTTSFWNDEYKVSLGSKAEKYDSSLLFNGLKTEESLLKLQVELFS